MQTIYHGDVGCDGWSSGEDRLQGGRHRLARCPSRADHSSLPSSLLRDARITQEASSYYLYPLELAILKEHSASIVGHLFGSEPSTPESGDDREARKTPPPHQRRPPVGRWRVGDWGGDDVGRHNGGVNSEEGMDEGRVGRQEGVVRKSEEDGQQGRLEGVVLELGAGSLGKTR